MSSPESRQQFNWKFPATLKNVEQVCSAAAQVLNTYPLHQKDRFAAELLVREAVNNAFKHGCYQDPLLSFSCNLTISEWEVIIEVKDEGPGFDWRKKAESPPKNSDESGRGLYIYTMYANSIEYNDAGNGVTLTRIFPAHCDDQGEKDG